MEEEKILIDRQTLKAIASDTRMDLLKYLSKRKYTLSELSEKTLLKSPTIKEHLDNLIDAGLVKREESENKWKYYTLTEKGKKLIKPKEVKILISFVISLIATFGLIGIYIFNFVLGKNLGYSQALTRSLDSSAEIASTVSQSTVSSTDITPTIIQSSFNKEIIIFIGIILLVSLTIFLLILTIKEKKRNKSNCIEIID